VLERALEDGGKVERQLRPLCWGLVRSWAKDLSIGSRMINARMETVHEKPAYRRALCQAQVPAALGRLLRVGPGPGPGRQEGVQAAVLHQPRGPGRRDEHGLYGYWRDPAAKDDPSAWVVSCTIIFPVE
jgi:hypothetical protein